MKVHVIGDQDTVLGFRLNGVEGRIVTRAEEARRALDAALQDDDIGLLLVTRRWCERMRTRIDRLRMQRLHPVVVEIPGPELAPPRPPIRELVRKAIGVRIDGSGSQQA